MNNEYIIINKTAIQKRIEELKLKLKKLEEITKENRTEIWQIQRTEILIELQTRKDFLSQSTPLIPILEDTFDSGENYGKTWCEFYNTDSVSKAEAERTENKQDYISNLKLNI